jgi:hypothetical protein
MGSRLNAERLEIHSLPALAHCFPPNFTFYVAYPIRSIRETGYLTFGPDCGPAVIAIAVYRKENVDLGIQRLIARHELRRALNKGTLRVLAMLTVSQLSKSFAGRALFDDVSLQVNYVIGYKTLCSRLHQRLHPADHTTAHQMAARRTLDQSRVYLCVYFGGGSGRSELNISTAPSHLPSRCLRTTVTNLPESLTGAGAPGGVIVIV